MQVLEKMRMDDIELIFCWLRLTARKLENFRNKAPKLGDAIGEGIQKSAERVQINPKGAQKCLGFWARKAAWGRYF